MEENGAQIEDVRQPRTGTHESVADDHAHHSTARHRANHPLAAITTQDLISYKRASQKTRYFRPKFVIRVL